QEETPQQHEPITTQPAELNPNAPRGPMPDIGVAWPELNAKETVQPPVALPSTGKTPSRNVAAAVGSLRYTVAVEGLGNIGAAEDLLSDFHKQSALEAERKDPANAAQIGRRAGADADLLTQLLRSQGYYDAQ